jgi:hypothetical protein
MAMFASIHYPLLLIEIPHSEIICRRLNVSNLCYSMSNTHAISKNKISNYLDTVHMAGQR